VHQNAFDGRAFPDPRWEITALPRTLSAWFGGGFQGNKEMRKGTEEEITHYCEILPTLLIASDVFTKRLPFQYA